jgi:hypothetical protein
MLGDSGPFSLIAGIPSIDLKFINSEFNLTAGQYFPGQHTTFDNLRVLQSVFDPDLKNLQTCAKMIVANIRQLVSHFNFGLIT